MKQVCYTCDRCGNVLNNSETESYLRWRGWCPSHLKIFSIRCDKEVDLCEKCSQMLINWLEKNDAKL